MIYTKGMDNLVQILLIKADYSHPPRVLCELKLITNV